MKQNRRIAEQMIFIGVDSYAEKSVAGRLWHGCRGEEASFANLMQLLLLLDKILEGQDFPEAQLGCKSFAPPETLPCSLPTETAEVGKPSCGALASFRLKILFRQNASWQGIVTWTESRQEQSFRSALELIMLLDSALTHATALNNKQIG